jgi:iron-sulfur cluster repair protein YtfE (RIC family)
MLESRTGAEAGADTVTAILGQDHRRLDGLLADAKRALTAGERPRAAALFAAFRDGLERHIVAEEEVLFPAFEALTGITTGPTRVMRAEHADIRAYLAEVANRLAAGGGEGLATPLASLTALLYAHNGKEERILYPATDRAAGAAGTLAALVARIEL